VAFVPGLELQWFTFLCNIHVLRVHDIARWRELLKFLSSFSSLWHFSNQYTKERSSPSETYHKSNTVASSFTGMYCRESLVKETAWRLGKDCGRKARDLLQCTDIRLPNYLFVR